MDNEQAIEKFKKYRETGDVTLRNELAEQYLYIAQIVAKKFVNRGVEYDDLYQVASLALIKGIERFNPDLGMQFSTFITPTITGEIKNYFRDLARSVKLPRKLATLHMQIKKLRGEMQAETGKNPTAKELASRLGVEEEDVLRAMEIGGTISLDATAGDDDEDRSLYEMIPDENNPFSALEDKESVRKAIMSCNDMERELLKLRYIEGKSQTVTAERLGVSQMFVSRLERKVLQKLKEQLSEEE